MPNLRGNSIDFVDKEGGGVKKSQGLHIWRSPKGEEVRYGGRTPYFTYGESRAAGLG